MELVWDGSRFKVEGPSSERAVVACASIQNGRIVYELPDRLERSQGRGEV